VSIGNIPIVVTVIAGLSGYIIFEHGGYTGNEISGEFVTFLNPAHYLVSLFIHENWSQYISSMYFFVPAGVVLTYITSNKNVLAVIGASHIFAVLSCGVWLNLAVSGTTAAAYGLLAATLVSAVHIYAEGYSRKVQVVAPVGILIISTLGLISVTETVGYAQVLMGFIFGGSFEGARVIIQTDTRKLTRSDNEDDFSYVHK
jgi:membrane associated rhomboid family serine protease